MIDKKNHDWPAWARTIARRRSTADAGVGDTVKRLLGEVGEDVSAILKAFGLCCGCSDRQAKWNAEYPYPKEPHGR